jgi:hypothetical protein
VQRLRHPTWDMPYTQSAIADNIAIRFLGRIQARADGGRGCGPRRSGAGARGSRSVGQGADWR